MYIVKAKNILNNREYAAQFETQIEANTWMEKHVAKQTWGKNARQAVRDQDSFEESLVLSEFEDVQSEEIDGFMVETTRTIVSLKAEYEVEGPTLIDGSGITTEDKQLRMKNAVEKANQFKVFKNFGETIQLYFTAMINERSFTQAQKDAVQADADVLAIMQQLNFGRIGKAKSMVDAKNADATLFFSEDLSLISKLMEDFLAENL